MSTFVDWANLSGSAIVLVAVFVIIVPGLRDFFLKYISARQQQEMSVRLEEVKSDLRRMEEASKTQGIQTEYRLATISDFTLSLAKSRQSVLDDRLIVAVENIWKHKEMLKPGVVAAYMTNLIKFDAIIEASGKDQRLRDFGKALNGGKDDALSYLKEAQKFAPGIERIFVSEQLWDAYQAYCHAVGFCSMQLQSLIGGLSEVGALNAKPANELIIKVLPHLSDYVNEHGGSCYVYILPLLDDRVCMESKRPLWSEAENTRSMGAAHQLISEVERIVKSKAELAVPDDLRQYRSSVLPPTL